MAKNGIVRIALVASAVMLITIGCAKKPKLNLSHLRDNGGAGLAPVSTNSDKNFAVPEFSTVQPQLPGGEGWCLPANGGGEGGGEGGWQGVDKPIGGAEGDQTFLVNAKAWEDKIYFDYNRYEIKASQRPILDKLAAYLNKNASQAVVIEGHCDERGSDEYNRSLSERRALAIRDYLNTLGIDNGRMFTMSYGEDRPAVPNATTEAEHRLNRRGQFLVGDKK